MEEYSPCVLGPTCWADLKTYNGKVFDTFQQACVERGLCEGDSDAREVMNEAKDIVTGRDLRHCFVTLIAKGMLCNPQALWFEFMEPLCEFRDERPNEDGTPTDAMVNKALEEIEHMLQEFDIWDITEKGLPRPELDKIPQRNRVARELQEELDRLRQEPDDIELDQRIEQMNSGQREVYDVILESVRRNSGKLIAIDAPGGTGKTFLLNNVLEGVRQEGKIALATAYTGIAAILLPGGATLHSKLKVPTKAEKLQDPTTYLGCTHAKSGTRKLLEAEETALLIIDEVTMVEANMFMMIDRTLRKRIRGTEEQPHSKPFGGLTVVVSGDWRQTLPVIPRSSRAQVVAESLKGNSVYLKIDYF